MLHSIDPQKEQNQDENDTNKVNINYNNINSITFNNKCSVITNLNASASKLQW